ncbi:MAG TPA: chromosome partitioning protein ParA, partial [Sphingomonas sp.]|nr:chromosome partitioning protein ParA [Sphingomonas sp.]
MTDIDPLDTALSSALTAVAGARATVRREGTRASIILDVTGLEQSARDALESQVKVAAEGVSGIETVRIAQT